MDPDADHRASISVDHIDTFDTEKDPNRDATVERVTSSGRVNGPLGNIGEVLARVELDLACSSEKLVNLSVLMMNIASRETDFEDFVSKKEHTSFDSVLVKVLITDLLSGILDSEVIELDKFMDDVQTDIVNARDLVSSCTHLEEYHSEMEEKLHDSEEYLKQSQGQLSEIRMQSIKLQRMFSDVNGAENWKSGRDVGSMQDDQFLNVNSKIKMQTAEQQRHILRLLEKSLAREIDLEKKLSDSKQIEEELRRGLASSKHEADCAEDDAVDVWERWLQADNLSGILIGISKELLGRIQIIQLNSHGLVQREAELRSKLDDSSKELKAKEATINKLKSSSAEHSQIENDIMNLKEQVSKAEERAESAEAKCTILTESKMKLNDELNCLRTSNVASSEKVASLEKQLKESDFQLQHAIAAAEANQEKQSMLFSTISDMQDLIDDLKLKASKAESRADSAEEKCIILSESHTDLTEELSFLRGRLEGLEASLHQADETKIATARDIDIRTKVITNLVMQLTYERERLHKQISSLLMENKILTMKLQQGNNSPPLVVEYDNKGNIKEFVSSKHDFAATICTTETNEEVTNFSATSPKLDKTPKDVPIHEVEVGTRDSMSELETMRRIDAGILSYKHILLAMAILLISVSMYFFQQQNFPF